ncbi:hypothetical protein M8818_000394 [Zalaria obscura]|uniref:Uncharacterized protein n=1 Tax=Zalaria obscura TaxID=2024903 RepID=A0ACC3SRC0_9PEZI
MTDKLPPNLLQLFAPRPALRYLPPCDHAPEERKTHQISGLAQYLPALQEEIPYNPTESWLQKRDRKFMERREKAEWLVTEGVKEFKPSEDPNVKGDPFKTLFVGRLSYDVTEKDLEREFGRFGPIERIRLVTDTTAETPDLKKKHRGYAFIVFERDQDMKAAYKDSDGIRIKDRRIVVDVERGRTVKEWRPRRFGGGLGGRGYTKVAPPRPMGGLGPPAGPGFGGRGGFGGGFRGGFRGGRGGGGFGGDRGGYRDSGRGGYGGGGRGVIGYQNGFAPEGAPAGPRGGGRGGYGGGGYGDRDSGRGGYGDRDSGRGGYGGGGRYDDRPPRYGGGGGMSGGNREPLGGGGGGYRDRDREFSDRKRPYDGSGGYDESRSKRRY